MSSGGRSRTMNLEARTQQCLLSATSPHVHRGWARPQETHPVSKNCCHCGDFQLPKLFYSRLHHQKRLIFLLKVALNPFLVSEVSFETLPTLLCQVSFLVHGKGTGGFRVTQFQDGPQIHTNLPHNLGTLA